MNQPLFRTTLTTLLAALTGTAVPLAAHAQERGRVISSTPVMMSVAIPREVCSDQTIIESGQPSGAGALLGGIAGGAAGNAIGDGSGRAAATAIGIIGGIMLGNQIEGGGQSQSRVVRRCSTQTVYENRPTAYDVVYEYGGRQYSVRMAEAPGEFVELQLNPVGALPEPASTYAPAQAPQYSQPYGNTYSAPYPPQYAPQYTPQYVPQYVAPQYIAPPPTRIIVSPGYYHVPPPRVIYAPPVYRPDRHRLDRERRDDRHGDRREDRRDDRRGERGDDRKGERRDERPQGMQGSRDDRRDAPVAIGKPVTRPMQPGPRPELRDTP